MNKNYPCFFICFNILCVHCKQFWGIMRKRGKNENQYLSCFHPPCPARLLSRQKQCRALKVCFSSPIFSQNGKPIVISHQFVSKKTRVYTALLKWDPFKGPGAGPSRNCLSPSFCYRSDQSHMPEAIVNYFICFCRSCSCAMLFFHFFIFFFKNF